MSDEQLQHQLGRLMGDECKAYQMRMWDKPQAIRPKRKYKRGGGKIGNPSVGQGDLFGEELDAVNAGNGKVE